MSAQGGAPSIPPYNISSYTPLQQAWIALSDLFRDTEFTDSDARFVARQLREAGFDAASAERVLLDDVAPVFGWNMFSVAGNWTGWNPPDVVELVNAWRAKRDAPGVRGALYRSAWACRFREWFFARMVMADWRRVAKLLPPNASIDGVQ